MFKSIVRARVQIRDVVAALAWPACRDGSRACGTACDLQGWASAGPIDAGAEARGESSLGGEFQGASQGEALTLRGS